MSATARARDLRAITADGVCFSVMVGLGESYVPAFALALGLGAVTAGLLAAVPMLLGACLQLVTPLAVRQLGSYRRWVVTCAQLQAFSFLPLVHAALVGETSVAALGIATAAYWGFGLSTSPAWNAWVTSLVPEEIRAAFFARRALAAQTALLLGLLAGGVALELGRGTQAELLVFAGLFAGALLVRLASALCLSAQSERPGLAAGHRALGPIGVWRALRGADSLRVLRYLLVMQLATNIAAPYFTPYMLSHLALSYGEFMAITAAAFASRIALLPVWGRLARRHGARRLLWIGGLGIVPLPPLWLVSDAFVYLLAIQLLAGAAWAAIELATTLSFFEGIAEDDRTSVLTVFNLANALAIAAGALIGAEIMTRLAPSPGLYAGLFAISCAGRLLAAALLSRTPWPRRIPLRLVLRTLAVRPSGIALERPILATLGRDDAPPPPSDPGTTADRSRA